MILLPTSPTSLRCCSIGGPRTRRSCPSKKLPIEAAALATHLNPGDMEAAWQNGLADEVARAFEEQLRLFQLQGTAMDPAQMNSKFADSLTHQRLRGPTGTWRSTLAASKNISGSRP